MPTPAERQALLFVAAVAALGVGFRGFRALRADGAPQSAQASLATQLQRVDSAITSGGVARARRPAARPPDPSRAASSARPRPNQNNSEVGDQQRPPEPVDVDLAGPEELDRLPGIGPALAARIVADREAKGPFGSLEQLQRVKGVGPALAAKLQPHVTFSLSPRLDLTEMPTAGRGRSP
ncbi:MAG: helix-hairpin-helix domain-containing protein [Gemmatimonadaceae bacterium]|nr:helix-hairpin-helix domain-containing protein [Gemmatimonadaceae bacterium]